MNEHRETRLEFPCDFPIKAMGQAGETQDETFEALVRRLVRRHVDNLGEGAVKTRPSRNGNYQSVTITIRANSKRQLDAIYQDLSDCAQVLMAL